MRTVLVVDDSRIMRSIVKNTFGAMRIPCQYLEAADGQQAFQLLENNQVSLVLLDWNMPKMDGIAFLRKIRSMPKYKNIPVIMITSESAKYNVIEALDSGASDYIVKPIRDKVFRDKLTKILG